MGRWFWYAGIVVRRSIGLCCSLTIGAAGDTGAAALENSDRAFVRKVRSGIMRKQARQPWGGIIILTALTVATLVFAGKSPEVWLALFITVGHGFIGFLDDFIKCAARSWIEARQNSLVRY